MTHQDDEFSQPYWWQSVSVTVVSAVSELELVPCKIVGPGEFFFWTHFRLSLWEIYQLRMRS